MIHWHRSHCGHKGVCVLKKSQGIQCSKHIDHILQWFSSYISKFHHTFHFSFLYKTDPHTIKATKSFLPPFYRHIQLISAGTHFLGGDTPQGLGSQILPRPGSSSWAHSPLSLPSAALNLKLCLAVLPPSDNACCSPLVLLTAASSHKANPLLSNPPSL